MLLNQTWDQYIEKMSYKKDYMPELIQVAGYSGHLSQPLYLNEQRLDSAPAICYMTSTTRDQHE